MTYKKIFFVIFSLLTILLFASCEGENADVLPLENTVDITSETTLQSEADDEETTESAEEIISQIYTETTTVSSDNPAEWSKAEIVEFYKSAAIKTNEGAKSLRNISLKRISINNGQYEGVMGFVSSIMDKIISKNSTEVEGITGGFKNLVETDAESAKAYKTDNGTVIEMTMVEQVDGAKDDMNGGTVGHAMSVVGDISVVAEQLKSYGLPLELSEKDIKIFYTNPELKVLVDGDGRIIKGTWSYIVDINMNNYKVFGTAVNSTSVVMENVITLNGGF